MVRVISSRSATVPSNRTGAAGSLRIDAQALAQGEGFVLHRADRFHSRSYFPVIDALEVELDELEDQIFSGKFVRSVTARIYHLRRDLLALKTSRHAAAGRPAQLSRMNSS